MLGFPASQDWSIAIRTIDSTVLPYRIKFPGKRSVREDSRRALSILSRSLSSYCFSERVVFLPGKMAKTMPLFFTWHKMASRPDDVLDTTFFHLPDEAPMCRASLTFQDPAFKSLIREARQEASQARSKPTSRSEPSFPPSSLGRCIPSSI